jgi:glutaconyl-CoA decarboxylase
MKKKYRVVIEGKAYQVEVEEIGTEALTPTMTTVSSRPSSPPPAATPQPPAPTRPVSAPVSPRPSITPPTTPEVTSREGTITAPIPGTVLRVNFKEGDSINQGDVLLILEAMKMENEIMASKSGTVKKLVEVNSTVDFGAVLCVIE